MMMLTNILLRTVMIASAVAGFTIPTRTITSHRQTALSMVADDAKVILVTGSSRGLGKSIALDLGAHQQKVVVNYVSEGSKAGAEATVEEIKALGGDAICVQADSTFTPVDDCVVPFFLRTILPVVPLFYLLFGCLHLKNYSIQSRSHYQNV
jgi:short chain dehydrogenase